VNIPVRCVVAVSVFLFACGDDSEPPPDAGANTHDGGVAGVGGGGTGGASGSSGTGAAGFGLEPPPQCGPFGCGMCFECGPGCSDCGFGCMCFDGGAPVPLPWDPPFDAVGEVGYRDSTDPWCSQLMQVFSLDVWSDARGVFAVASGFGPAPVGAPFDDADAGVPAPENAGPNPMNGFISPMEFQPRSELWWNDGSNWKVSFDQTNRFGTYEVTGVPGAEIMVNGEMLERSEEFGPVPASALCALTIVDGSGADCLDLDPVSSVFVVDAQRAAAVMGGSRLLTYDGDRWRGDSVPTPFPVTEVWADASNMLAAGRAGVILWREGDGWRLEDPGTIAHITSVWGTSREDVWAGTSDGHILHYDGIAWTEAGALGGVTCEFAPPITGIWGSGGDVYFHSATQLARIRDGNIETLANWSCSPNAAPGAMAITGIWGNAPDEVFIGIIDNVRSVNSACGGAHVVYYDGETFHRM